MPAKGVEESERAPGPWNSSQFTPNKLASPGFASENEIKSVRAARIGEGSGEVSCKRRR